MSENTQNKPIPTPMKLIVAITILIVLGAAIPLNILFHNELFWQGVDFIYDYQTNGSNGFVTVVFNLITLLGNTYFVLGLLVLVFLLVYTKITAILYISLVLISVYGVSVMKQGWQ